jgi:hypothetical protein
MSQLICNHRRIMRRTMASAMVIFPFDSIHPYVGHAATFQKTSQLCLQKMCSNHGIGKHLKSVVFCGETKSY